MQISNLVCDTSISIHRTVRTGCFLKSCFYVQSHHWLVQQSKDKLPWKGHQGHWRCLQYQSNAINVISDYVQQHLLYWDHCCITLSTGLQCWSGETRRRYGSLDPTYIWWLVSSEIQLTRIGCDGVLSWLQLLLSGHLSVRNWNAIANQVHTSCWAFSSIVTASHQIVSNYNKQRAFDILLLPGYSTSYEEFVLI